MTHILVIDDSPTMRNLVKALLDDNGYVSEVAEDGVDGLGKVAQRVPDLVITDINMPRMNGYEFCAKVRETKSKAELPIIALTTETSDAAKAKMKTAGVSAWVAKPYSEDTMIKIVKDLLR